MQTDDLQQYEAPGCRNEQGDHSCKSFEFVGKVASACAGAETGDIKSGAATTHFQEYERLLISNELSQIREGVL